MDRTDVERTNMEIIPWGYVFTGMGWVDGEVHIREWDGSCCPWRVSAI